MRLFGPAAIVARANGAAHVLVSQRLLTLRISSGAIFAPLTTICPTCALHSQSDCCAARGKRYGLVRTMHHAAAPGIDFSAIIPAVSVGLVAEYGQTSFYDGKSLL